MRRLGACGSPLPVRWLTWGLVVAAWWASGFARGQAPNLPAARLTALFPPGAAAGTTVEVTLSGQDLDDATALIFSDPAISAAPKTAEPGLGQSGPQPVPNVFVVTVKPEAPPGLHEARLQGKYGLSNPRTFVVGNQKELVEKEPNNTLAEATAVPLDTVVNGRSNAATDQDFYKFTAQRGQRVLIDCWAYRIDSPLDATLKLLDASGRELESSRDFNRRDPLLDFTVPADGEYVVVVHDFIYSGGEDYYYRLSLDTRPHVDFVWPPSGPPGATSRFTVYGRNLPGGQPAPGLSIGGKPLEMLPVDIAVPADPAAQDLVQGTLVEPAEMGVDAFAYRLPTPTGPANAVPVGLAQAPVVLEQEPNDAPAQAPVLSTPVEYVGRFYPRGDRDWIAVQAKAGDVLAVDLLSERLGSPTDPVVVVQQVTKGEQGQEQTKELQAVDDQAGIGPAHFDAGTEDPALKFVAPADGLYRIGVRDQASHASADPRHAYRLIVRPPQPDYRLAVVPRYPAANPDPNQNQPTLWTPLLRKGGAEAIDVVVYRRDGFDGEIVVAAENLPPGVSSTPVTIGPGRSFASLVLTSADNAGATAGAVQVVGRAQIGGQEVVRRARAATMVASGQQNQVSSRSRAARSLAVATSGSELAPFALAAGQNLMLEMCRAGNVQVPLALARRGEFKGNVAVSAVNLPLNVQPKNLNLDANTAAGNFEIGIQNNAPLGTFSFHLYGTSQVSYARNPEAAQAAAERKAAVDKLAADAAAAAKAAADAKAAAEKTAAEMAAAAQRAAEAQKAAEKTLGDANATLAAAQQAAQAAGEALAKDTANAGLQAAKQTADNAAGEAAGKAKAAAEVKAAADKAAADAAAQAKVAADQKAVADQAAAAAEQKSKDVAAVQQAVNQIATDLANRAKPANVNVGVPSTTVTLKITAAPISLSVAPPTAPLKQGAKLELPVTINRLYNFGDAVPLRVQVPSGVGGLNIPQASIPAGAGQVNLAIEAAAAATPGTHKLLVQAVPKFNGQDLVVEQPLQLVVEKVEPAK